jgi:hypothetical protein
MHILMRVTKRILAVLSSWPTVIGAIIGVRRRGFKTIPVQVSRSPATVSIYEIVGSPGTKRQSGRQGGDGSTTLSG